MPGQIIAQPNPPPDPSHLPDSVREYAVQLKTSNVLTEPELRAVQKFRRAANYIAAGTSEPKDIVGKVLIIFHSDDFLTG
jgi:xylulose-5-phosphate/fructose-6-phosphate phosphoketolase